MITVFTLSTPISQEPSMCGSVCQAMGISRDSHTLALKELLPLKRQATPLHWPCYRRRAITATLLGSLQIASYMIALTLGSSSPPSTQEPEQSFFKPQNILYVDSLFFPSIPLFFLKKLCRGTTKGKLV